MQTFRILLLFLGLMLGSHAALAGGFLSIGDDLPLAPGLSEIPDSSLVFDGPGGRILQTDARGPVRGADVMRFYAATLPQLGWVRESDFAYSRDNERLRLELTPQGTSLLVHFTLSPE